MLGALFFSGTFFVLAFPFFTYVPSSGAFGPEIAKARAACSMCMHPSIKL